MLLLFSALAWAVPTKTLEAGIDRRVLLIDLDGRQIDCSLVAVQDERLVVRLDDGSLASVERSAVANLVDLGPAPPPPVEDEPEIEDDFGEGPLEGVEDDFDVEGALDELLDDGEGALDEGDEAVDVEAIEPAVVEVESDPEPEPVRVELPEDDLDLPESDGVADDDEGWEDPIDAVVVDPPAEDAADDAVETVADDGVADVQPEPIALPPRDPQADNELYYRGRADGAAAAKDAPGALPQGIGFAGGCLGSCVGCTGVTLAFALVEPDVPSGGWQEEESLYQQGYLQSYRDTYQRDAARRAFLGGAIGAATTAVVAVALIGQI